MFIRDTRGEHRIIANYSSSTLDKCQIMIIFFGETYMVTAREFTSSQKVVFGWKR